MKQLIRASVLALFAAGASAQIPAMPDPMLPPFPALEVDVQPLKPVDTSSPYASPADAARHRLRATLEKFKTDRSLPDAIRGFEQALAADPAYSTAAFNLGVACALAGKWDDAAWAFEEAVRLKASLNATVAPELERVRLIARLEKTPDGASRRRFDEALARELAALPAQSPAEAIRALADLAKSDLKRWEAPALIAGRAGDSGEYETAVGFLKIALQRSPSALARPKLDAALAAAQREVDYAKAVASAVAMRQQRNWATCAEMYESAWRVFPARIDNGMEAATAWLLADDTVHAVAALNRLRAYSPVAEKARAMLSALAPVEPTAAAALRDQAPSGPPASSELVKISVLLPDVRTTEMPVLIREPLKFLAETAPARTYDALAVDPVIAARAAAAGMPELPAPLMAGESPQRELAAFRQPVASAAELPVQTVSRATAGRVAREIHIQSSPAGAQVTVGDESQPVCRTPCIVQTSAPSENLRVETPGYHPAAQVARFAPRSNTTDVSLVLEPIRGHVLITAAGTLFMNGKAVDAVLPGEISLLPGLFDFEIRQGARVTRVTLGVRPDSRIRLPLDPQ